MNTPSSLLKSGNISAVQAAERIRRGEITSEELTQQCIERIKEVNSEINAVVIPLFEQALVDAKRLDVLALRGEYLGPLHGVPMTIKECFFLSLIHI